MYENIETTNLPTSLISDPVQALRGPERHDEDYTSLTDSIRARGVLVPILVRPDPRDTDRFILVDGMQRLSIAKAVGLREIPARVLMIDEEESLNVQVVVNVHRVATDPMRYASQFERMMRLDPSLTVAKLCVRLDKSPTWVYQILSLNRLVLEAQVAVEDGRIPLANATVLAKLPPDVQAEYVDMAIEEPSTHFVPMMTEVARQTKASSRPDRVKKFRPTDYLQPIGSIKNAIRTGTVCRELFKEKMPATKADAFRLALEWVLHRDPISIRYAQAKMDAYKAEQDIKNALLEEEAKSRRRGC